MTRISFILFFLLAVAPAWAESDSYQGANLIDRYQEALQHQQEALRNLSMEVHMEGSIPKLKKQGKMSALRKISSLGKVTYKVLGFWGDDTVKKEVMARFMTAEVEAAQSQIKEAEEMEKEKEKDDDKDKDKDKDSKKKDSQNMAISPQNYEFKYKGLNNRNGQEVHIFELKPSRKRIGLFKGELWLDPATCLPIQEFGRLVKNPSVFVKKMEFVRSYEIKDGVAYLKRMESRTETRIVGRADLNIEYANFSKQTDSPEEPVAKLESR